MANSRDLLRILPKLNRTNDEDFCGAAPGTVLLIWARLTPNIVTDRAGGQRSEADIDITFRYRPSGWNDVPPEEIRQMVEAARAGEVPYPSDDFSDLLAD